MEEVEADGAIGRGLGPSNEVDDVITDEVVGNDAPENGVALIWWQLSDREKRPEPDPIASLDRHGSGRLEEGRAFGDLLLVEPKLDEQSLPRPIRRRRRRFDDGPRRLDRCPCQIVPVTSDEINQRIGPPWNWGDRCAPLVSIFFLAVRPVSDRRDGCRRLCLCDRPTHFGQRKLWTREKTRPECLWRPGCDGKSSKPKAGQSGEFGILAKGVADGKEGSQTRSIKRRTGVVYPSSICCRVRDIGP
jgi:hypothetical protein